MNNSQNLEETLRRWKLRAPSPQISARLFDLSPSPATAAPSALKEFLHWLVPVAGCALLALATLPGRSGRGNDFVPTDTNGLFASMGWGGSGLSQFPTDASHSEFNNLPRTILRWTINGNLPSTHPNSTAPVTNFLYR